MPVEIADRCRRHGPESRAKFGGRRLPRQLRARQDLERCRTETLGGQGEHGEPGGEDHARDPAWKHRPCPKCQQAQAAQGRDHQHRRRRPVPHVLVTFTLPAELRALARRHQKPLDTLRLRRSAAAFPELALAPRFLGGRIGMVGGLHPWPRHLRDQPHGPDIVPAGGLTADDRGRPARPDFLGHVTPLSVLCRAKCRDARHKTDLVPLVAAQVWTKDWVVHCAPVGRGAAALRDLAPDSLRVALSTNRLRPRPEGHVTWQYKASPIL